ncbi:mandelate racemase/muconate lactonizing enzyme family protein [Salinifilum ghardaiensis]
MQIGSVDVFAYPVRYAHGEYVMSGGRAASAQDGTLVRLRTEDGLEGWGEATPLGATYLPMFAGGVRAALQHLAPVLLGADPTNLARVNAAMDEALAGHESAKSAVDVACWDVLGQSVGRPVVDLLGGRLQEDFPLYEAVPLGSPGSMAEFAAARTSAGITRFQLKVGNEPTDDVARTRATREAAGEDAVIIADANTGWSLLEARRALRGLGELDVLVEQPCRTTEDCALVHRGSAVPLVLDESVLGVRDLHAAKFEAGAVAVNVKIGRIGGLTRAACLRDAAEELGLALCLEDTWGGDVATAAVSHLAAGTRTENLLHASFYNDWTDGHVAGHEPRSDRGRGAAPTAPGLGIQVDPDLAGELLFSAHA